MRESWSEPEPLPRRDQPPERSRSGAEPFEQGLDRLVSAGRHLVDGVSGARPGSRPSARGAGRGAGGLPRLNELGRWVETKLDWILDEEDDWREPWQEPRAPARSGPVRPQGQAPGAEPQPGSGFDPGRGTDSGRGPAQRRPLEAISRRGRPQTGRPSRQQQPGAALTPPPPAAAAPAPAAPATADPATTDPEGWPDEASFALPRWQRPLTPRSAATGPRDPQRPAARAASPAPGRSLPRSSRRRPSE